VQPDLQALRKWALDWCQAVPTYSAHGLTFEEVLNELHAELCAQLVLEWAAQDARHAYSNYVDAYITQSDTYAQQDAVGLIHCFVPITSTQSAAIAQERVEALIAAGASDDVREFARLEGLYSTSHARGILLWLTKQEFARMLRRVGIKKEPHVGLVMIQETSKGISVYVVCGVRPACGVQTSRETIFEVIGCGLREGIVRDEWNRARLDMSEWGQQFLEGRVC
jgi:hypothetical protein